MATIRDIPGAQFSKGQWTYGGQTISPLLSGEALQRRVQQIDEQNQRAQTKQTGLDIAGKQQQLATEFRSQLPTYTGLLQDQAKKTIQRNLAENIAGLKQQSASRGFLRGSGTQRQQAEQLAGAQTETMQKESDIQDMLETQAKQFENQALATKMSLQGSANQATIDALRQNILDTQRQSELWRALGGAVGTGVGAYYGAKA